MRHKIKHFIFQLSHYVEILVSILIMLAILATLFCLAVQLFLEPGAFLEIDSFTEFLANALSLIVGVEFVKLLCKHTPETLIEVLMFAIARQVVVEHWGAGQILLGIVAIVVLFVARRYLIDRNAQKEEL